MPWIPTTRISDAKAWCFCPMPLRRGGCVPQDVSRLCRERSWILWSEAAITALSRHGDAKDAMLIAPFLSREVEANETVRWYAAAALQRLHNVEVIPVLEKSIRDEEETG